MINLLIFPSSPGLIRTDRVSWTMFGARPCFRGAEAAASPWLGAAMEFTKHSAVNPPGCLNARSVFSQLDYCFHLAKCWPFCSAWLKCSFPPSARFLWVLADTRGGPAARRCLLGVAGGERLHAALIAAFLTGPIPGVWDEREPLRRDGFCSRQTEWERWRHGQALPFVDSATCAVIV